LDHDGYLPEFAVITDGKTHEVTAVHNFRLPSGSIIAVDRAYYDFDLFYEWHQSGVHFATRLKDNAAYEVIADLLLPKHSNILADWDIRLAGYQTSHRYPELLRVVIIWDEENQREIKLLTNLLESGATTVGRTSQDQDLCGYYRQRFKDADLDRSET
jgi:hypothetical protein